MRIDSTLAPGRSEARFPPVEAMRTQRRLDRFELLIGITFAAVSVWVLGLDLYQVLAHGRVWTGTDGFFVVDQMQYLAWIRDASHHFLASNLYVLRHTPADYFQPAVAVSGGVAALGVPPSLALLLWKPIAVAATFFGARAYAHKTLNGAWERRAALALALFFGSFTVVYGSFSVVGDLFPGFLSWGYTFGLLAVGVMVIALLFYDRDRQASRLSWAAGSLGALASGLHPWQGELLILVILGTEAARWRGHRAQRPRLAQPALTVVLTGLPLLYYAVLDRTDLSWSLARDASRHSFSFWSIMLAIAPLLIPALLGYRGGARSFLAGATRAWPLAALLVYVFSATGLSATPLHAFEGITIPLAVLAVGGLRDAGWRRVPGHKLVGALAIAAATIPATAWELAIAPEFMEPTAGNANFITHDERAALDYLAREHDKGGVLTRFYLGAIVPARTGRRTFVGNCLWSEPGCTPRAQIVQQLLDGTLAPQAARSFVSSTGARFVLSDCQEPADLTGDLRPLLRSVRRFGCASVYELQAAGPASGPLAASLARRL